MAQTTKPDRAALSAIARKLLWLSAWTIHDANHLRDKADGLKEGGHQASFASRPVRYGAVLRSQDRVAVKPHAGSVFHALQYMADRLPLAKLRNFRVLGGAQSCSSRTKDVDDVDFSTSSVGLGVAHGAAWRKRLVDGLGDQGPVSVLLDRRTDGKLAAPMENLGGHCIDTLLDGFGRAASHDRPTALVAYTIKVVPALPAPDLAPPPDAEISTQAAFGKMKRGVA